MHKIYFYIDLNFVEKSFFLCYYINDATDCTIIEIDEAKKFLLFILHKIPLINAPDLHTANFLMLKSFLNDLNRNKYMFISIFQ